MSDQPSGPAGGPALAADLAAGRESLAEVRGACPATESRRLLAIVTAATGSELHLPVTVPLLLRQADAAGLAVDLVLGLNNGYRCDPLVADLARRHSLPVTEVVPSLRGQHSAGLVNQPAAVLAAPDPGHRLVVVAQPAGPHSQAKTRIQHDIIAGLLLPALRAGWVPPRWTLLLDAESLLIQRPPDPTAAAEISSARELLAGGLPVPVAYQVLRAEGVATPATPIDPRGVALPQLLATAATRGLDLVGAATRFTAFRPGPDLGTLPVLLPAAAVPVAPPYDVYSLAVGLLPGCGCLSGAATLGRTEPLLALMAVILGRHAQVYGEDALLTVLAGGLGLRLGLDRSVAVTNRCPGWDQVDPDGRPAWLRQVNLWYSGFAGVADRYGAAAADVVGPAEPDARAAGVVVAARTAASKGEAAGREYLARLARSAAMMADLPTVAALAGAR